MNQKIYQVDAFTNQLFGGNPAAVCPLDSWPQDDLLQKIALENNLSETAFYVKQNDHYQLRWFTPTVEVALCGHATLAAAWVLFHIEGFSGSEIHFESRESGQLTVKREGDWLTMNFPADLIEKTALTAALSAGFNVEPVEAWRGKTDFLLIFETEQQIKELLPDFNKIGLLDCRGVIVTAPGKEADFVSRFFGPQAGVNEDPVTGSAHTTLTPYWAQRLGKTELSAIQLSQRQGHLKCHFLKDRVEISGQARLYLQGYINII